MQDEDEPSQTPDPEQGITPEEHGEKEAEQMDQGNKDEDIYDETGSDKQTHNDEITSEEGGFVQGYEKATACTNCGNDLTENSVDSEVDDEIRQFCSQDCVDEYLKNH
jgi:hypothetical protein